MDSLVFPHTLPKIQVNKTAAIDLVVTREDD